jgi:sugar/nucleoside kinase (ribokinase family)
VKRDIDLLVIGDVNADLLVKGDDPVPIFGQVEKLVDGGLLTVGGSSSIMACGASRLGLRTALVGVLADDALGSLLRTALEDRGVDVSACLVEPGRLTGITVVLMRGASGDRAILTATGTAGSLSAGQVNRDVLGRSNHLHCGGYFLQPRLQEGLADLFCEARRMGIKCSLDTNWDPAEEWNQGLAAVLGQCDLFFPNEAEALSIGGCTDIDSAVTKLSAAGPTVVVKRGAQGGMVRQGSRTLLAAAPRTEVVDSTGAGDAFDAGYLFGFIRSWETARCLSLAIACGSLSTRGLGGVEGQPSLEEALTLASTIEVRAA